MILLPLPPETEHLITRLSEKEKNTLSMIIQAFVSRPKRTMPEVMDSMAEYARQQGLNTQDLNNLLKEE